MIYLKLFWVFFQVGLFSIGGGYAAIPLIQNQVVEIEGWLTFNEFTDLLAIAEMTPGPIAINSATFAGMQTGGLLGAVIATFGFVFPSLILASILAYSYYRFQKLSSMQTILKTLRPVVIAAIGAACLSLIILAFWGGEKFSPDIKKIDLIAIGIFCAALFILRKFKPNPVLVLLGAGSVGALFYLLI
jgi:chromate transporter